MTRGVGGTGRALTTAPLPGCLPRTLFFGICVSESSRMSQATLCRWSLSADCTPPTAVPHPTLMPSELRPMAWPTALGDPCIWGPAHLLRRCSLCCRTAWACAQCPQPRGTHVLLLPIHIGVIPRGFWVDWQCPHQR